MRKLTYFLLLAVVAVALGSCHDEETYADQVKRERSAINAYIADNGVNVISEEQFNAQGQTTDVSQNQFVLFQASGLYLQIIRKGNGNPIADGESATVLCRFTERNLLTDSIQLSNTISPYFYKYVEKMTVVNNSGTFTGSFVNTADYPSLMATFYGTTSVPSGWLAVLPYINLGRWDDEDGEIAKVRIIVPHDLGQQYAVSNVYPCLYDITFQRGR